MKHLNKLFIVILSLMLFTVTSCQYINNTEQTVIPKTQTYENDKVAKLNIYSGKPNILHPSLSVWSQETWILQHLYKGLYTQTPSGIPSLAIAKNVNVSPDGLEWTFELKDFYWSSGNKGCADDFVQSYLFTLNPENNSSDMSALWIFKNAEQYSNGEVDAEELGIQAIDDSTLLLTLHSPIIYLPDLLTNSIFYPIDSKNAYYYPHWYETLDHYSTNGAFTLDEWIDGQKIILAKNDTYYDSQFTNLDKIIFTMESNKYQEWQMYLNEDIDIVYNPLKDKINEYSFSDNSKLKNMHDLGTCFVYFNVNKKPFNNAKVRNALSMSISREYLTDIILDNGQRPAYTITPTGMIDTTGNEYTDALGHLFDENVEEAKILLAEGLAEEGINKDEWTFEFLVTNTETQVNLVEAIAKMWQDNLGFNCSVEVVDPDLFVENIGSTAFDICRMGWIGDYVDPLTFLDLFTTTSQYNNNNWSNAEYDELINSAKYSTDNYERMQKLQSAETILIREMAVMPIYYYSKSIITKPYLINIYTPINAFPNLEFADILI